MTKFLLYALLVLLAFSLPFEIIHPILLLPWFAFTNLELLALASIVVWLVDRFMSLPRGAQSAMKSGTQKPQIFADFFIRCYPPNPMNPRSIFKSAPPLLWLPVLFLALTLLSAALAPAHRLDALKFATRVATGLTVFWMLVDSVRSRAHLAALLWALVLGAGFSALVGLGEALAWPPLVSLLPLFKEAPTLVGGTLRVSASLQYATIAAIFFEMSVPLALALAATARTRLQRGLALAVALLCTASVVLTLSRAGMALLAALLALLLALAWRQPRFRALLPPTMYTLAVLLAVTGALAWRTENFRTRLVTENDLGWYGAAYSVPASLRLRAGEAITLTVSVQNTGTAQWHTSGANPFALAYYWLLDDGQVAEKGHVEVALPQPVAPRAGVDVAVTLRPALPPGDYQLVWGMLQHNILWFRHRNVPEAHTYVHLEEGAGSVALLPESGATLPGGAMLTQPPTVGRLDLWRAALRIWAERPLLGVGPDNFRHLYGRYLNLSAWDDRLHANNLYLELLTGWGVAGTLAFASLLWVIARRWLRLWRAATGAAAIWSLALGSSFLIFFLHGFLDYFLEFVPLYLLFWMVTGLIVALSSEF